jgi:hypothetical protein
VGGAGSAGREKLNVDLLMVRNRVTGRFIYTEQLERRPGETTWEYVRREAQVRDGFKGETLQVIVGWGVRLGIRGVLPRVRAGGDQQRRSRGEA